eukprot:3412857-Amphidinium_carterae.1
MERDCCLRRIKGSRDKGAASDCKSLDRSASFLSLALFVRDSAESFTPITSPDRAAAEALAELHAAHWENTSPNGGICCGSASCYHILTSWAPELRTLGNPLVV